MKLQIGLSCLFRSLFKLRFSHNITEPFLYKVLNLKLKKKYTHSLEHILHIDYIEFSAISAKK